MFFASPCPRWNRVYKVRVMMKIGLLPTSSLPGPQNIGWTRGLLRLGVFRVK